MNNSTYIFSSQSQCGYVNDQLPEAAFAQEFSFSRLRPAFAAVAMYSPALFSDHADGGAMKRATLCSPSTLEEKLDKK